MPVEITVRGTHRRLAAPERATVHASVALEGSVARDVYRDVVAALTHVSTSTGELHDPDRGPVTWWSYDQVRTWSDRPWNQDGRQLPLVHHARAELQAKFSDFAALGSWLDEQTTITGFAVGHIQWALTEVRRTSQLADVRTSAVRDAVEKAQTYADALELGAVRPIAIADAGLLGGGVHPKPVATAGAFRQAIDLDEGGGTQFVPQDVELRADVDARFAVGD